MSSLCAEAEKTLIGVCIAHPQLVQDARSGDDAERLQVLSVYPHSSFSYFRNAATAHR